MGISESNRVNGKIYRRRAKCTLWCRKLFWIERMTDTTWGEPSWKGRFKGKKIRAKKKEGVGRVERSLTTKVWAGNTWGWEGRGISAPTAHMSSKSLSVSSDSSLAYYELHGVFSFTLILVRCSQKPSCSPSWLRFSSLLTKASKNHYTAAALARFSSLPAFFAATLRVSLVGTVNTSIFALSRATRAAMKSSWVSALAHILEDLAYVYQEELHMS